VGRRGVVAAALLVVTWLAYRPGVVSQSYNITDPLLTVPTSMSMLRDGDLELSEFVAEVNPKFHGLLFLDGRPYNRYPIGASLLVLPLVWLAGDGPPDATPMAWAMVVAASCAKVVAALSVALLFLVLAEVSGRIGVAFGLALVFAFATPHYPIHAGGLWTHNVVQPLLLVALLLIVLRDGRYAWLASLPLAFAFVTRPTTAVAGLFLSGWIVVRRPRVAPAYVLLALAVLVPFFAWSRYMYGALLPPYYVGVHTQSGRAMSVTGFAPWALLGNLVSPNRGLFVFAPVVAFALWGMVRAVRRPGRHAGLLRLLAVVVVVQWVVISSIARNWWAGWSFGPRNFMEAFPLWIVLLVPAIDGIAALPARSRRFVAGAGGVALAWSLFVAVYGANAWEPHVWNAQPVPIQERPERLWDWRDMQILRGTGLQR
jgi:hypothetical protein